MVLDGLMGELKVLGEEMWWAHGGHAPQQSHTIATTSILLLPAMAPLLKAPSASDTAMPPAVSEAFHVQSGRSR